MPSVQVFRLRLRRAKESVIESLRLRLAALCFMPLFVLGVVRSPGQPVAPPPKWPGAQADGSVLLHNQWSLRPAGQQIDLGSLPVNLAVHPKGQYVAALNSGYGPHEVVVVDLNERAVVSRAPLHDSFYGLTFSADGNALYCSGGGDEVIHRFAFVNGKLPGDTEIKVRDRRLRAVPCGVTVDRAQQRLFIANVWGDCASEVDLGPPLKTIDFSLGTKPAHLAMAPLIPPEDFDTTAAEKRAEAAVYSSDTDHTFPYGCCLDEKGQRLYVSLWAQSAVKSIDLKTGRVLESWPVEEHPCEMALTRSGKLLYVANANRNTVTVLDTATGSPYPSPTIRITNFRLKFAHGSPTYFRLS